ncbi:MAG: hypothetical protein NWS78_11590 [Gammaproteobacteria bacterium]|jgi:hypothetical protein|nr:hypothetical protein [Gammaproteobacteria bacterium]
MLKELYVKTGYVLFVAALWTLLFYANGYFFDAAEIAPLVSLIFLPAALRPVAVLLFGVPGAVGLILGAALTIPSVAMVNPSTVLIVLFNGVVAWGVLSLMRLSSAYRAELTADMTGLSLRTILVLSASTAIVSSTLNSYVISLSPELSTSAGLILPMMIGDAIGALLMLYLLSIFSPITTKYLNKLG